MVNKKFNALAQVRCGRKAGTSIDAALCVCPCELKVIYRQLGTG